MNTYARRVQRAHTLPPWRRLSPACVSCDRHDNSIPFTGGVRRPATQSIRFTCAHPHHWTYCSHILAHRATRCKEHIGMCRTRISSHHRQKLTPSRWTEVLRIRFYFCWCDASGSSGSGYSRYFMNRSHCECCTLGWVGVCVWERFDVIEYGEAFTEFLIITTIKCFTRFIRFHAEIHYYYFVIIIRNGRACDKVGQTHRDIREIFSGRWCSLERITTLECDRIYCRVRFYVMHKVRAFNTLTILLLLPTVSIVTMRIPTFMARSSRNVDMRRN